MYYRNVKKTGRYRYYFTTCTNIRTCYFF